MSSRQVRVYWNNLLEELTGERDYTSPLGEIKQRVYEARRRKKIAKQVNPVKGQPIEQTKLFENQPPRSEAEDSVDPATYDQAVDDFWMTIREVTEIVPMGKPDLLDDGNGSDIDTVVVGYPCRKKREDQEQVWRF